MIGGLLPGIRRLVGLGVLLCASALAEHYTVPLLVPAGTSGEPTGVLRVLNGTDESGTVEIYAIDDAGRHSGPATFTLDPSAAVEFTAADLQSGNATLGLTGGIGANVGDARLRIETELDIVPLAYVRAADGTLSAMHDTVRVASAGDSDRYTYDVPVFNPSTRMTQVSRLRLINLGDADAAVTISGLDDNGAPATGGVAMLTIAVGGASTLTSGELEAGGSEIEGRLGAGTGTWRLTVSSDQPLQVMNIVVASAGYWNNLSTTAVAGAAPAGEPALNERFVGERVVYETGRGRFTLNVLDGARFTETGELDGVTMAHAGSYSYSAIGPDAGQLTLDYENGDMCRANFYFSTRTSGWLLSHCTRTDDPDGYRQGGNWSVRIDDESNRIPGFRLADAPGEQTYTVGTAIVPLTLPEADGGNGDLSYALWPSVPGLSFNAAMRQLTGTPVTAGTHAMTYTVRDEDGDTDTLDFTITVQEGTDEVGFPGDCSVGLMVEIGQSCTYPATTDEFSVNVRGRGSFLGRLAGIRIRIDNETINGRVYDFLASHQGDGAWRIDRIAGNTETPVGTGTENTGITDTDLSFAAGGGPGRQTYALGTVIETLTLPAATGGDGVPAYSLLPRVPGLSFDAVSRQLTGMPEVEGAYAMAYTAIDGGGDTVMLNFFITVAASTEVPPGDPDDLFDYWNNLEPEPWWRESAPYSCRQVDKQTSPWIAAGLTDPGGSDPLSLIRYYGNGSYVRYANIGLSGCTPIEKYDGYHVDPPADPTYYSLGDLDIHVDIARVPASASGWTGDNGSRVDVSMDDAVSLLNEYVATYYRRVSRNRLRITFHPGFVFDVEGDGTRAEAVDQRNRLAGACLERCIYGDPGGLNRILFDDVAAHTGGFGGIGSAHLGFVSVLEANMLNIVHEIGHGWMSWPHSFAEVPWRPYPGDPLQQPAPYSNYLDVMSRVRPNTRTTSTLDWDHGMPATLAINRYSAGWIDPEDVALHVQFNATYTLSKPFEDGYQFLVINSGRRFAFTTLEVIEERSERYKVSAANIYDPSAPGQRRPRRYDGVLVSRFDQSTGTGTFVRFGPAFFNRENPDFLMDVGWGRDDAALIPDGGGREIGGGVSVSVAKNPDGSYQVTVSGGTVAGFEQWCEPMWFAPGEFDTGCFLDDAEWE